MSKLMFAAALLALAACGEKKTETTVTDTAAVVAPAPTPAPATVDTTVRDTMAGDTTKAH